MPFLQAEWRKLALVNYWIDPKILVPFIPAGTELDFWQNKCYVSLVGFMFQNTKLLGIRVPLHINFEEVNLRFYVKRKEGDKWKRGVVFVKEIVPKPALTFVANTLYKENYVTMPMKHSWNKNANNWNINYQWKSNNQWNSLEVIADCTPIPIVKGSETEFITEHYWGYASINQSKAVEYEVTHPTWEVYPVKDFKVMVNFEEVYGPQFAFINKQEPQSVMLAEGSAITVESKKYIFAP